jgi:hypothetical protein
MKPAKTTPGKRRWQKRCDASKNDARSDARGAPALQIDLAKRCDSHNLGL